MLAVRIVGENRTAGRSPRRRHDPVVGADGVALLIGLRQKRIGIMKGSGLLTGARE